MTYLFQPIFLPATSKKIQKCRLGEREIEMPLNRLERVGYSLLFLSTLMVAIPTFLGLRWPIFILVGFGLWFLGTPLVIWGVFQKYPKTPEENEK